MQIIDTHHHLWDTNYLEYAEFKGIPGLERPFTVLEFEGIAARNGVTQSVCVEAASGGADGAKETQWLLQTTRDSRIISRLVVWAPVERYDVRDYLDRLVELNDSRIMGVRRGFETEPPDFPRREEVIRGVQTLASYGYTFDIVLYHLSLFAAIELVKACPNVRFILDHLGKPDIRRGLEHPWREHIAEMASFENVICKVSGLITEADPRSWTKEQLKPYINHAIQCFGWDRVVFGSDWPVCTLAGQYEQWVSSLQWAVASASEEEKSKLFSENARRLFQLPSV
jgi:L-fuconolactonase